MRRPLTWVSGGFLAAIFLVISALVTHAAAPATASASTTWNPVPQQRPAPPPRHHARADEYTRPVPRIVAAAMPLRYTARPGDTLSSIARRFYGSARLWPALWYTNRSKIHNPDALPAGTTLALSGWHPDKSWVAARALAAIPKPPPKPHPTPVAASAPASNETSGSVGSTPAPAPVQAAAPAQAVSASGYEACVIQAESGGDTDAINQSSGASGLYGFLDSTWQSVTGLPGAARDYSQARQQAAFEKLYGEAGRSPWETDGC